MNRKERIKWYDKFLTLGLVASILLGIISLIIGDYDTAGQYFFNIAICSIGLSL